MAPRYYLGALFSLGFDMNILDAAIYPLHGTCQCKQVRYTLHKPPAKISACHCLECQTLSTSAFSMSAFIELADIEIQGELYEWSRPADNGNTVTAKFCPSCSNRIYHFNPDSPNQVKLKPIGLPSNIVIEPSVHIWVKQKQSWINIPEHSVVFETQP